jgi:hypothetical protein
VNNIANHDKVRFELDGVEFRTEGVEPYALAGDEGGDYLPWTPTVGSHTITAVVLDTADDELAEQSVSFSVTTGTAQEDISFTLINASTDQDIGALADGATIDLDQVGNLLNVRATVNNIANHDKVRFELDGVVFRTEGVEPYALAGDEGGDYLPWTPTVGSHTITAVVLDAADEELDRQSISFSVTTGTVQAPVSFALIDATTDQDIGDLADGATIDLDQVGVFLNIRATVLNIAGHDKVRFELDGAVFRTEASEPYALAGNEGTDYLPWTPTVGSHTLTAVVLDADDAELDQHTIGFSVTAVSAVYDKARGDLIALHYDHRADPDDGVATAAGFSIAWYFDITPIVVSGAYGCQPGVYQTDSEVITNTAWGSDWLNAHDDWTGAVAAAAEAWNAVLSTGAHVWIAEGGQSDFSADVVRRLLDFHAVDGSVTQSRIHLVQHSNWNERYTCSAENCEIDNLGFVRDNTHYIKIPDGNRGDNGTADLNITHGPDPDTAAMVDAFVELALAHQPTRAVWQAAFDYLHPKNEKLDFSDTVELLYILGIGTDEIDNCGDFANFFLSSEVGEDTDNDGLPDAWELLYSDDLSLLDDRNGDYDEDGVTNWIEYQLGSNPIENDLPGPGLHYEYDALGRLTRITRIPAL